MNPTQVRAIGRPILLLVFACSLVSVASAEWDEKVLYSFQGVPDGSVPAGGVVFDKTGNLYGATQGGGSSSCDGPGQCGTVYQLTPPTKKGGAWTETVLYVFKGHAYKDGATPEGGVVMDQAGNLYGTTGYGGSGPCTLLGGAVGCGTVYEISPPAKQGDPWTETVLYSFQGGKDGYVASGDLVFDKAGNLYGATLFGGGKGTTCDSLYGGQCGTVFKVSPSKTKGGKWTEKVLHQFSGGTDGANPNGGLVLDSKRAVYGTTPIGGNQLCNFGNGNVGCGITFRLSAPTTKGGGWTEDVVHRFTEKDGASPNGGLIFDAKGGLYGTTGGGGGGTNQGVVFRFDLKGGSWVEDVIHIFGGVGNAPCCPTAGLTLDTSGRFFGVSLGGQYFRGTAFRLEPPTPTRTWRFALVDVFRGAPDAAYPEARFIFDSAGNLYGTTQGGGGGEACEGGCGTVYELKPPATKGSAWTGNVIYRFNPARSYEAWPLAGLIMNRNGHLFGTTHEDTVFRLAPNSKGKGSWTETILYSFNGKGASYALDAPLIFDSSGNLCTTAYAGSGGSLNGNVFRLRPPRGNGSGWTIDVLYSFTGSPDGAWPAAGLTYDKQADLYSTTQAGGTGSACQDGCGTVFEVSP